MKFYPPYKKNWGSFIPPPPTFLDLLLIFSRMVRQTQFKDTVRIGKKKRNRKKYEHLHYVEKLFI